MSSKSSELQNKKNRLGRGLGSLLGGATIQNSVEEIKPNKSEGASREEVKSENTSEKKNDQNNNKIASAVAMTNQVTLAQQVVAAPIPPESRIWKIPVDKLNPNEFQPRQQFNKETLKELSDSIREKGILQPIVARKHQGGSLEIISGERRWRAAQAAGLHEVPVIIKNVSDQDSLELAIIENIQREDLNPIDEAEAYQRLAEEFKLTQQQVADKVGKERATVANSLRLLSLPLQIRELLSKQELSVGHAKVLLSINDSKTQNQLAKKVIVDKLSVRALEKTIQGLLKDNKLTDEDNKSEAEDKNTRLAEAVGLELQRLIGTKVNIDYNKGKGKITLTYYSDEEFNDITERIKKAWQKHQ